MPRILLLLFCSMVLNAHAEWSKPYEVKYPMGDGDNRASARQLAVDQIKLKAASEAGTYIEGTTTLHENGELTENIMTLSASMVKISNIQEIMSVSSSGQAVLQVSATASVDENELQKRVEVLQQDKVKARQIKQLQSENDSLRRDLAEIRHLLGEQHDQAKVGDLLARQDAAIRRIEDNNSIVTQVFAQGALLQMAGHNSDALSKAKKDIDDHFYQMILDTKVTAVIESVEEDRGNYIALVRVGWDFDRKKVTAVLRPYLDVTDSNDGLIIYAYKNLDSKGPSILSDRIYGYLTTKGVDLELTLANKTVRIPAFYWEDSFNSCDIYAEARVKYGERAKDICLPSQPLTGKTVHGMPKQPANPVKIKLTRAEAERATSVAATWKIMTQ